jgi:hypothetical protein
MTRKICQILNVECDNFGDDVMREVDQRIEDLGCAVVRRPERRDSRLANGDDLSDRGVCELLEKIEGFGESEKIFDRNMLRAEYHKELSKVRKRGKKSN